MGQDIKPILTVLAILILTFLQDLTDLSFRQAAFFLRTLRFWLYFVLHCILSGLGAYLLNSQIDKWYILALVSTVLGVGVIANSDIRIAGQSLLPIAEWFSWLRAQVLEQAADEKAAQIIRAEYAHRLQRLNVDKLEVIHSAALLGARRDEAAINRRRERALKRAGDKGTRYKLILIDQLMRVNEAYVAKNIERWE